MIITANKDGDDDDDDDTAKTTRGQTEMMSNESSLCHKNELISLQATKELAKT